VAGVQYRADMTKRTQAELARQFLELHRGPGILVLPNAWDVASARIFEDAGFPAIGTTSAGVANSFGYPDGQKIPRQEMLGVVRRIAGAVEVPVTADVEAGFGSTPEEVADTAREVIAAGAVGMNLEDGVDGKPDLLVGSGTAVAALMGNGDGTFQPLVNYFAYPPGAPPPYGVDAVTVADLDGDGKPDLLTANQGGTNSGDGSLGVLLSNGGGSFQPVVIYDSGGELAFSAAIADVNGDGKLDLVTGNQNFQRGNGSAGVLLGNGDGTFRPVLTFDTGGRFALSVAVADVNGDGKPDLLAANEADNSVAVLINGPTLLSTSTAVTSSINPVQPRQRVDYTATVTTENGGTPTGTVTFRDGNQTLATAPIFGNQAVLRYVHYTQNDLGGHGITAIYSGDANYDPSTSPVFAEYVKWTSRIDLKTSGSPSLIGQPVTFTATPISHGNFVPDGEIVTFFDFKTQLGIASTAGGRATFTTSSLSAKRHTIRATYPGDGERQQSAASLTQVVNKYSTTSSLTSSPNPSAHGQTVTFTVTVTRTGPFTPTGRVKLLDGTTGIGFATLSDGTAILTKSTLATGTHPITALYLGDDASDKSTSSVVNQVVNP